MGFCVTFNQFNRRLHLYLALTLLPWIVMYGISAIPMTRPSLKDGMYNDNPSLWTTRSEHQYERVVPDGISRDEMRQLGRKILKDFGIEVRSTFGAYSLRKKRLTVYASDFWSFTRITYNIEAQHVKIQDKQFRWSHFLTGLHGRGGFAHETPLNYVWSVLVDLVALGFLLWIASGLYMWWQAPGVRRWGFVALLSGLMSFTIFVLVL
jgi:hypothetical protein